MATSRMLGAVNRAVGGDPNTDDGDFRLLELLAGLLTAALPPVLMGGVGLLGREWQPSLSQYYYTRGRDYFEGTMCALAPVLTVYHHGAQGPARFDKWASNTAALGALGVAAFPASRHKPPDAVGLRHLVSGLALFGSMDVLCVLFAAVRQRRRHCVDARARFYLACAGVIAGSLGACFYLERRETPGNTRTPDVVWFETAMVEAFAAAWLVKSREDRQAAKRARQSSSVR